MESVRLVVPVRFTGGGLSMQTTTSTLSAESVFIRCLVAPKVGAVMEVAIALPDFPKPFEATGTVTERVSRGEQGRDTGFLVRFGDFKGESREKLDKFLRGKGIGSPPTPRRTPPPPAADGTGPNRAFARVPARLQVGWASPKEFLVTYSENISRGGIFVATEQPPELRSIVELLLELPDNEGPAKTQAEVVQRVTVEEAKRTGGIAGAGLQFLGSDDGFRLRLDACIDHLLTA